MFKYALNHFVVLFEKISFLEFAFATKCLQLITHEEVRGSSSHLIAPNLIPHSLDYTFDSRLDFNYVTLVPPE